MLLSDLIAGVSASDETIATALNPHNSNPEIKGIAFDNRRIQPGYVFVALRGEVVDGHKFIERAIEAGAAAILCEDDSLQAKHSIPFIKVKNSRKAGALLAHSFYNNPANSMNFIGITGTNGKTTCSFLIANMLRAKNEKVGIIGTTGIYINDEFIPATHTTPESIELAAIINNMKQANVDSVAMEVSSHALAQHRTDGLRFSAALFTNLSHEHLDYHHTLDEYVAAKKMLFQSLDEDAIAIVFDASDYTNFILSDIKPKQKIIVGYGENSDIRVSDIELHLNYSKFKLTFNYLSDMPSEEFTTSLIGKFNIENAALSVAYLVLSGTSIAEAKSLLAKATGAPGRMDRIKLKNGAIAVVDYAHTPDALEKALLACRELLHYKPNNKLISVFGCGGDRDRTKRPIMGKISTDLADFTVITDDNPRTEDAGAIRDEVISGIDKDKNNYAQETPRDKAIAHAYSISNEGDIILIAGKGHENYQIIGTTKYHSDDKEIVQNLE